MMMTLSDEWDWDEYWDAGGPHQAKTWADFGMHIVTLPELLDFEDEDEDADSEDCFFDSRDYASLGSYDSGTMELD